MAKKRTKELNEILQQVRDLAVQYYDLTGKPLGVTGELAEFEAARLLGLDLAEARQSGFDASRRVGSRIQRVEIKGRRVVGALKPGSRVGAIRLDRVWDVVLLVLLDEQFRPTEILEAKRGPIERELTKPGSKARNERGQLSVSQFRRAAKRVWSR